MYDVALILFDGASAIALVRQQGDSLHSWGFALLHCNYWKWSELTAI